MNDSPEFRYYPCDPPAMAAVEQYMELLHGLEHDRLALEEQFRERLRKINEGYYARMYTAWTRLTILVGLDPAKTWGNTDYHIETRFMKHGFAAVVYEPAPHPPAGILGLPVKPSTPEDGELVVPKKEETN